LSSNLERAMKKSFILIFKLRQIHEFDWIIMTSEWENWNLKRQKNKFSICLVYLVERKNLMLLQLFARIFCPTATYALWLNFWAYLVTKNWLFSYFTYYTKIFQFWDCSLIKHSKCCINANFQIFCLPFCSLKQKIAKNVYFFNPAFPTQ